MDVTTKTENFIVVDNVSRVFADRGSVNSQFTAVKDVSLTVRRGEFICIVGPSGCGKSTLLRAIAGVDAEHTGTVKIAEEIITKPSKRRGMVFQESRLFAWMNVKQNIEFALNDVSKEERIRLVQEHVDLVKLNGFEDALPKQLSGGMAQRVSIARALVNKPEVLLMDEPFGALDYITKISMQNELIRIQQKEKMTVLFVTHDIDEAVYLSNRVVVMSKNPGMIKEVVDCPLNRPRDRNSREFIDVRRQIYKSFGIEL